MDLNFLRLGHLGEIHIQNPEDEINTLCGIRCDGPNFSPVAPLDLSGRRRSPQLCSDCSNLYDENLAPEEEDEE